MQNFIQQKSFYIKKIDFLKQNFDFLFEYFFIGFILGNLFGSFLTFFRHYFSWDGLWIICIIFLLEIFNWLFFQFQNGSQYFPRLFPIRIGVLLGFFVDAYKVGS